jgi:hypothetical protein
MYGIYSYLFLDRTKFSYLYIAEAKQLQYVVTVIQNKKIDSYT